MFASLIFAFVSIAVFELHPAAVDLPEICPVFPVGEIVDQENALSGEMLPFLYTFFLDQAIS